MRISAIAIISKNRGLGFENKLLFHVPGELPRFKQITMGHPVIMGRKTHESIGRVLPGRLNIVVSRNGSKNGSNEQNLQYVTSLEVAIKVAKEEEKRARSQDKENEEIFILGGGQIFQQALPITDRLYLTIVDHEVPADTFFPEYEKEFTKVVSQEKKTDWEYPYRFITLER